MWLLRLVFGRVLVSLLGSSYRIKKNFLKIMINYQIGLSGEKKIKRQLGPIILLTSRTLTHTFHQKSSLKLFQTYTISGGNHLLFTYVVYLTFAPSILPDEDGEGNNCGRLRLWSPTVFFFLFLSAHCSPEFILYLNLLYLILTSGS